MGEGKGNDPLKVADRMRALCSRREYCSSDILKKVTTALDGDKAGAAEIVSQLVKEKYIDDLRYASAYARDKSSIAGWGETKIRYMLSSKGIPKDVVNQAFEGVDEVKAAGRLEKLMENKARSLREDPHVRLKLLRFGMGRGYSYDDVAAVTEDILRRWKDD